MEPSFEEAVMAQPALAGIGGEVAEIDEALSIETVGGVLSLPRRSVVGFFMNLLEAWPLTNGPFFTADGQFAACQAQECHHA